MAASSILLANRNPSAPLTAYDGKVGAIIGKYVYTSPNESFIPHPLLGHRHVRVREDYRYGPDDHTLWPQPYSEVYPHLGAIPRRPKDPNDPLQAMWYDPVSQDFVPANNGSVVDGLGKLSATLIATQFSPLVSSLQDRCNTWSVTIPNDKPVKRFVSALERALHYTFVRLQGLVTTWHQIRFTLTELQRYYLELLGCLDYVEIYKPLMDTASASESPMVNTIGVFTNKVRIVEEFMASGIPVWFIREFSHGFGNNVLEEVAPTHYYGLLNTQPHELFTALFSGDVYINSAEVVGLVHSFSRRWSCSADPFEDLEASSTAPPRSSNSNTGPSGGTAPQASSSGGTAPQASSSRPSGPPPRKKFKPSEGSNASKSATAKPKNPPKPQRDKFVPLEGPMAPFSIPAWANALRNVDKSQPLTPSPLKRGGVYAYPDPGLFLAVETEQRRQHLIEQYARIQSAWISRLHTTPGASLSSQQWRDLLTINFRGPLPDFKPQSGDTQAMQSHRKALRLLIPPEARARKFVSSDSTFVVGGERFESGVLPPPSPIRRMLYELYELNFRKELLFLHCLAHPKVVTSSDKQARQFEVQSLFPGVTYYIPPVDPPNSGAASDDIRERLPFVVEMAKLMDSWKGQKPPIFQIARQRAIGAITTREAHDLEQAVAGHYCQQFYNYFRRAAQIPHRPCPVPSGPASAPSTSATGGSVSAPLS